MDRHTAASLDRWLTTPPDDDEPPFADDETDGRNRCPNCDCELADDGECVDCAREESEYQTYAEAATNEQAS